MASRATFVAEAVAAAFVLHLIVTRLCSKIGGGREVPPITAFFSGFTMCFALRHLLSALRQLLGRSEAKRTPEPVISTPRLSSLPSPSLLPRPTFQTAPEQLVAQLAPVVVAVPAAVRRAVDSHLQSVTVAIQALDTSSSSGIRGGSMRYRKEAAAVLLSVLMLVAAAFFSLEGVGEEAAAKAAFLAVAAAVTSSLLLYLIGSSGGRGRRATRAAAAPGATGTGPRAAEFIVFVYVMDFAGRAPQVYLR